MSRITGVSIAELIRRGIESLIVDPPTTAPVGGEPRGFLDLLELEEAAMEAKARMEIAEAQRMLKRIKAWRAKQAEKQAATSAARSTSTGEGARQKASHTKP
jgi:hypothetical protein